MHRKLNSLARLKVATGLNIMVSTRITQREDRLTTDLLRSPHRRLDHRPRRYAELCTAVDRKAQAGADIDTRLWIV